MIMFCHTPNLGGITGRELQSSSNYNIQYMNTELYKCMKIIQIDIHNMWRDTNSPQGQQPTKLQINYENAT